LKKLKVKQNCKNGIDIVLANNLVLASNNPDKKGVSDQAYRFKREPTVSFLAFYIKVCLMV